MLFIFYSHPMHAALRFFSKHAIKSTPGWPPATTERFPMRIYARPMHTPHSSPFHDRNGKKSNKKGEKKALAAPPGASISLSLLATRHERPARDPGARSTSVSALKKKGRNRKKERKRTPSIIGKIGNQ